jgi:HSP20 family protein
LTASAGPKPAQTRRTCRSERAERAEFKGEKDMATELEKRAKPEVSRKAGKGAAESLIEIENAFLPDAAIYETEDNLFIRLDIPGVEKGQVQIEVDEANVLQIRAKNEFQEPEGIDYREFEVGDYYRSFNLGDEFNKDAISAKLEDGVLELSVPKREEVKPKRISIKA